MKNKSGRPPTKDNRVRLHLMCDKDLKKRIKKIAVDQDKSVSDILHEALGVWLTSERAKGKID